MQDVRLPPVREWAVCLIGPDLWFRREPDGSYVIGFTDAAQRRSGPVAHYRGPEVGRSYRAEESALTLESEKWVGHLALPVAGIVVEVNPALEADPALINLDPYGSGWLYRMRPGSAQELEALAAPFAEAPR
jgi:glycine cleavage system H protein